MKIPDLVSSLAIAWAAIAALQLLLWLVQLRTRNAGIVDVGWAGGFAIVVAILVVTRRGPQGLPIAIVVSVWSLRLTGHLLARGAATGAEEGRYVELRRKWAPYANRAFFIFFQAQALMVGVLSIAIVPSLCGVASRSPIFRVVGIALATAGILGESIADAQLVAFKRTPTNKGRVCDVGLWSVSRHPNYFFESLVWVGYATYATAFPYGALAWIAPALITASIFKVTGIPATEAQARRSKGDAYAAYQARVSAFVPWFPKR